MNEQDTSSDDAPSQLDHFDRAILKHYHLNTKIVSERLGELVNLSPASVQRRVKRLRATGVIKSEVAHLDAAKLGFPITCVVGVDVEYERAEQIDQFKKRMLQLPNVQQCFYVTGQLDFILVVTARDMVDFEAFTRKAFLTDANVKSFTTYVVMDKVKEGFGLPL